MHNKCVVITRLQGANLPHTPKSGKLIFAYGSMIRKGKTNSVRYKSGTNWIELPPGRVNTDYFSKSDMREFVYWVDIPKRQSTVQFEIKKCVELRSLKFYLMSYRQVGIFHEHVVNRILGDFVEAVEPKMVTVYGDFKIRGGLHTTSEVTWEKDKA